MLITTLVENTSSVPGLGAEHGLSLFIEAVEHKVLFDTGASPLFAENAVKLGIDLSSADIAVISHGHYDHGGGLQTFLSSNSSAPIYIHQDAFEKHLARRPGGLMEDIGLDPDLLPNGRFVLTGDWYTVWEGVKLFSDVPGSDFLPSGNAVLFCEKDGRAKLDDFRHEQNLIICEGESIVLITGCSHRGIINIVEGCRMLIGRYPTHVLGGFHLSNPAAGTGEDSKTVIKVAERLLSVGASFWAGHCTGEASCVILKSILGEKLGLLSTGSRFLI